MKGRKPIPTKLHILRGNPSRKKLPNNEPQPKPSQPTCPSWLSVEARREWRRVAPELLRLGLLTVLDRAGLAVYCTEYSNYVQATKKAKPAVINIKDSNGNLRPRVNPWVKIASDAAKSMLDAAKEFGMTPSSRSRVTAVETATEPDPFSAYLGKGDKK